jgi:phenylalanyl-tRNA synthetase beta chain
VQGVARDITDRRRLEQRQAVLVALSRELAREVDLDALLAAAPSAPVAYEDLLTVPVSRRDLALVVPEGARSADLVAAARQAGAPLVRSVRVFDRYAGEQVGEGRVGLALRLELADPGRTLTDEEIDAAVGRVRASLESAGARLRS